MVETEPGVKGRHRLERDEARDARDRRGRPGSALRERRRPDQGRHARAPLHLARLTAHGRARRHDDPAPLARSRSPARVPTRHAARARGDPRRRRLRLPRGVRRRLLRLGASRRGVESPWERIRALARALRDAARDGAPRALPRRLAAALARPRAPLRRERGRERHRRLPDPRSAQRPREPRGGRRGGARGREGARGRARAQPRDRAASTRRPRRARAARRRARSRRASSSTTRPARSTRRTARELVEQVREASGLPGGLLCQGAGGRALAAALEAARGGADRDRVRDLPRRDLAPPRLGGGASQSLAGIGMDTGVDLDRLWQACELVDAALGEEPVPPLSPRVAVRAAEHRLPAGLVAEPRRRTSGARASPTASTRCSRSWPRVREEMRLAAARGADRADPRLAGAPARPLGAALAARRRRAARPRRRAGTAPRRARSTPTVAAGDRAPRRGDLGRRTDGRPGSDDVRDAAEGLAASEEELLLLALFGDDGRAAPRAIRARGRRDDRGRSRGSSAARVGAAPRADPRRPGVGDRRGDDRGGRDGASPSGASDERRRGAAPASARRADAGPSPEDAALVDAPLPPRTTGVRVESPMVGMFYRAPAPGRGAVRRGGRRRRHRADALHPRGDEAHERGQGRARGPSSAASPSRTPSRSSTATLLFELEPLNGRPLDAL